MSDNATTRLYKLIDLQKLADATNNDEIRLLIQQEVKSECESIRSDTNARLALQAMNSGSELIEKFMELLDAYGKNNFFNHMSQRVAESSFRIVDQYFDYLDTCFASPNAADIDDATSMPDESDTSHSHRQPTRSSSRVAKRPRVVEG